MSIAMLHQRDSFTYDIVIEKKMWLDRTGITPYPWSDLEGELLGGGEVRTLSWKFKFLINLHNKITEDMP